MAKWICMCIYIRHGISLNKPAISRLTVLLVLNIFPFNDLRKYQCTVLKRERKYPAIQERGAQTFSEKGNARRSQGVFHRAEVKHV